MFKRLLLPFIAAFAMAGAAMAQSPDTSTPDGLIKALWTT